MQETLTKLFKCWAIETINKSNEGLSNESRLQFSEKELVDFVVTEIENNQMNAIEGKSSAGKVLIYKASLRGKEIGKPFTRNETLIERVVYQEDNSSNKEKEGHRKISINKEKIQEWEKTNNHTHNLSAGLGVAAYGAQAQVGYQTSWGKSIREKSEAHEASGTEISIPITIPAGGATYNFDTYGAELHQKYQLDQLLLQGKVLIHFKNHHKIRYENEKFVKMSDLNLVNNTVVISVAEIFRGLIQTNELREIFLEPSKWKFENEKDRVCYTGQANLFKFFIVKFDNRLVDGAKILAQHSEVAKEVPPVSLNKESTNLAKDFIFKPGVNIKGTEFDLSAEALKSISDERFKLILGHKGGVEGQGLDAAREEFHMLHKDRPRPEENKDRPVTVGHTYNYVATKITITADSPFPDIKSQSASSPTEKPDQSAKSLPVDLLLESVIKAHTLGCEFKLTRPSPAIIKIELSKSGKPAAKNASALDELIKNLDTCVSESEFRNKVKVTRSEDEDLVIIEGDLAIINQVAMLFKQVSGEKLAKVSSQHAFFQGEKLQQPAEDKLEVKEKEIHCVIQ